MEQGFIRKIAIVTAIVSTFWILPCQAAAKVADTAKTSIFGSWEFTSNSQRGPRTRILKLNKDMTGTYQMHDREVAIKDFKVDGAVVTFKVDLKFGERSFAMEFKGKLQGETLKGEFITSRGKRPAEGKRLGSGLKITPEKAGPALDKLIQEAKTSGTIADPGRAAEIIKSAAKGMKKVQLLNKLAQLQSLRKDSVIPRPKKALSNKKVLDWTIMELQTRSQKDIPVDHIKALPIANAFPGAVAPDAKRVTKNVEIRSDRDRPGWRNRGIYAQWQKKDMQSTGLYAAPGEVITVTVPKGAESAGLSVRIGAHTDHLWRKDSWRRAPEITRVFDIKQTVTKAANAFGGPVYIETPHECTLGNFTVKIENAVQMAWYIAGKTTDEKWKKIRNYPAPWAELQTDKIVLTLQAEHIRDIENIRELMAFWDGVMDCYTDLLGKEHGRKRMERFVTDTQISNGYMHSGYPLMTGLDIGRTLVSKDGIVRKSHPGIWGLFHEIGHNHQNALWTYRGTTEVTVNLFSLYVFEKMCRLYPKDNIIGGLLPAKREKKLREYLANGARFDEWKKDPFLALCMYLMIQEQFGWKPFTDVFVQYRSEDDKDLPTNDDQKRDQWMVRMSKRIGKNLGPYFDAWGVPVSEAAKESIADLPTWMPEIFSKGNLLTDTTCVQNDKKVKEL